MSNQFIPIERDQPVVIPVQEWLAEDHLARFIVEIVESLDVTPLEAAYRGGGSAPYPPKMMLALLFYGYATGIFSSRALEQATYELIPVIYITGNTHPDHNSINTFRKRFLGELKGVFVQILLRAYALGVLQLGKLTALALRRTARVAPARFSTKGAMADWRRWAMPPWPTRSFSRSTPHRIESTFPGVST